MNLFRLACLLSRSGAYKKTRGAHGGQVCRCSIRTWRYLRLLVMRDVEGLSGKEVCSALDLSEAAMKSRLRRARLLVRDELQRSMH
ncbi:MAG TPA: sigma factor-like helix-turn-helix DNA-binding protein [Polyangiaceae bacterium]|nr:sigma factor-like helix-turn-helix DNA-binding protein [Polyangiaceae bacterium]